MDSRKRKLTPERLLNQRYQEIEELFQRGKISDVGRCVLNAVAGTFSGMVTWEDLLDEYVAK